MIDPNNLINITGGLVADPELVNGKILKIRIGVDYSGSDKDTDNNSGYFDVVYYLKDNSGFVSKNASFVGTQLDQSKLKKGSTISIVGRLVQERWKQDDQARSRIVIVAEHLTYSGRSAKTSSDSTPKASAPQSSASIPSSF
jgi:single-stranded DNA-binding protein